ncbi:MAG: M6 family metalloprotease domain-containing protein [candidate division WOR-3 bacterium]|nr:M6 family metalloprotease domain-containing protein [candidate division WOR-3 bacterium]
MVIILLLLISMPPSPYTRAPIKPPRFPALMNRGPGFIQPVLGEKKAIVILVDFSDNIATYPKSEFDSLIYGENENSMRKYFNEVSYGKFTISKQSNIIGWVRAPQNYQYYVGDSFGFYSDYPNNVQRLVMDACSLADPYVNFSDYDGDGDGIVDGIFIVHAGPGAEETGNPRDIWSHQWQLSNTGTSCPGPYQTQDGVKVDYYSMEPERLVNPPSRITVGVFVHEFGHVLGLPDLYDTDYSTNGIGIFCLMAAGSWGKASSSDKPGNTPSHPSAWCKYQLGWLTPTPVERTGISKLENQQIPCSARSPFAIRMLEDPGGPDWNYYSGGRGEYFLIENRYRTGFDRSLPGDGLLILHVDDSRRTNENENHPLVGIMQADGDGDFLLPRTTWGKAEDLWKNDTIGFYDGSTPSSRFYGDSASGVTVYDIGPADSIMTASFWISPIFLGRVASYPNPFRIDRLPAWGKSVVISYTPSDTTELGSKFPQFKVTIYNIAGERIRVLDDPNEIDIYRRCAFWDLKNEKGNEVVSGMYIYLIELQAERIERSKGRLTIIR